MCEAPAGLTCASKQQNVQINRPYGQISDHSCAALNPVDLHQTDLSGRPQPSSGILRAAGGSGADLWPSNARGCLTARVWESITFLKNYKTAWKKKKRVNPKGKSGSKMDACIQMWSVNTGSRPHSSVLRCPLPQVTEPRRTKWEGARERAGGGVHEWE